MPSERGRTDPQNGNRRRVMQRQVVSHDVCCERDQQGERGERPRHCGEETHGSTLRLAPEASKLVTVEPHRRQAVERPLEIPATARAKREVDTLGQFLDRQAAVHELLPKRGRRTLAFSVADDRHRPIVDPRNNPSRAAATSS